MYVLDAAVTVFEKRKVRQPAVTFHFSEMYVLFLMGKTHLLQSFDAPFSFFSANTHFRSANSHFLSLNAHFLSTVLFFHMESREITCEIT